MTHSHAGNPFIIYVAIKEPDRFMAPVSSEIPVAPAPKISAITSLMCTHEDCFALFSNLEDSEEHAIKFHAGKVAATSCGIYEHPLQNGEVELRRILEEGNASPVSLPILSIWRRRHYLLVEEGVGGEYPKWSDK
jgi:hypothetical protein